MAENRVFCSCGDFFSAFSFLFWGGGGGELAMCFGLVFIIMCFGQVHCRLRKHFGWMEEPHQCPSMCSKASSSPASLKEEESKWDGKNSEAAKKQQITRWKKWSGKTKEILTLCFEELLLYHRVKININFNELRWIFRIFTWYLDEF